MHFSFRPTRPLSEQRPPSPVSRRRPNSTQRQRLRSLRPALLRGGPVIRRALLAMQNATWACSLRTTQLLRVEFQMASRAAAVAQICNAVSRRKSILLARAAHGLTATNHRVLQHILVKLLAALPRAARGAHCRACATSAHLLRPCKAPRVQHLLARGALVTSPTPSRSSLPSAQPAAVCKFSPRH